MDLKFQQFFYFEFFFPDDIDLDPVPMDLETETLVHHHPMHSSATSAPVDIENELREFLEGGSGSHGEDHDTSSIEQMLLD